MHNVIIISGYKVVEDTDTTCVPIKNIEECQKAGKMLGLCRSHITQYGLKRGCWRYIDYGSNNWKWRKYYSATAQPDGQSKVSYDPPYCYFEGGDSTSEQYAEQLLKFNNDGSNTGPCGTDGDKKEARKKEYYDRCLCCDEVRPAESRKFILKKTRLMWVLIQNPQCLLQRGREWGNQRWRRAREEDQCYILERR